MNLTDWIVDIALVALVLRQVREARFDTRALLLPLGLIGWSVSQYLTKIPTAGNDLVLIGAFVATGVALGVAGGLTTRVRTDGGTAALVKAGWLPATLWVASMTARMGFLVWVSYGSGTQHLASFSLHHDITSADAWQDALLLMALSEVGLRLGLLKLRANRAVAADRSGERAYDLVAA